MPPPFPIVAIEKNVYSQLEASKKIFELIPKLTAIARKAEQDDQLKLEEFTKKLLEIGIELSDSAHNTATQLTEFKQEET